MIQDFTFERRGRSSAAALIIAGVYIVLIVAMLFLNVSIWIVGIVFVFTLPAIWDLTKDTRSGMFLSENDISWFHGKNSATIELSEIERFRIDLRMDRSVKLSVELKSGRKIRLPQPSTPPLKDLERELTLRELAFRKNPFALL